MRATRKLLLPLALVASVVAVFAACTDDKGIVSCKADVDCPPGNSCRDSYCGTTNPDAGLDATDPNANAEAAPTCSADGVLCALATDCCGGTCDESHCSSQPVTTPACKDVYQLCQNDCCAGLTCTNGSCR